MADEPSSPFAPLQVASVQTLLSRGADAIRADFVIIDECHHFVADEFKGLAEAIGARFILGLTATPERGDGRPLGDLFDELVVACHYSELVGNGVLTPCRILRPKEEVKGVAQDPVEAYLDKGEGRSGFVFVRNIEDARKVAERFSAAGVPAEAVDAETPKEVREAALGRLRSGSTRLLVNVYALTEGVDVPNASIAIIARGISHVSTYLQICGRVLRSAPGKEDALILDLPGVSWRFGAPIEDRVYSLDGDGIKRKANASLSVCLHCGFTYEPVPICPRCGQKNPTQARDKAQRIFGRELQEHRFAAAPDWEKRTTFSKLQDVARKRNYGDGWIVQNFVRMYGHPPKWLAESGEDDRRKQQWLKLAQNRTPGQAAWLYHRMYGSYPPAAWRKGASK